jgi:DNA polymerase-1
MKRTLLIDADIVAYKFASSHETVLYFNGPDEEPSIDSDFEGAAREQQAYIEDLANKLAADRIIICLSDPDQNFRKDVDPTYKSHRVATRKPTDLMALKDWFKGKYETYQRPKLEADDCMGILSTHPTLIPGERVIVSEDKDMQTIPGLLFNPRKDKKPRKITKRSADNYFLWQAIVGDTADGYPGAKGVGPKSPFAVDVLQARTLAEAWAIVVAAFESKGFTKDHALVQARLARILRASDWNFKEKSLYLWMPPALDAA